MMTKGQQTLLDHIRINNRLPTIDEAIDMYVENSLKDEARCIDTWKGKKSTDYPLWELKGRASMWLRVSLGSLIIQGKLKLGIAD